MPSAGLEAPSLDTMGRPGWDGEPSDVTRNFRLLSRKVHPDRCKAKRATDAFDAVKVIRDGWIQLP